MNAPRTFFEQDASLVFPTLKQVNLPTGRVYQVIDGANIGDVLPSITRVLGFEVKPQLEAWKRRVGKEEAARISARASVRGSGLHSLAELYLSNQDYDRISPSVMELWHYLRPWLDRHIVRVYAQEQDLCSCVLGVAGRTDLLADVNLDDGRGDVFSVVDFKQANKPKKLEYVKDYFLQGTFYAAAVYEHAKRMPQQIVFPVTSPDGLQIFVTNPNKHFAKLRSRIGDFYAAYEKDLDVVPAL